MLGEKKKSSHRLSSLFSVGSSDSHDSKSTKASTAPSSESSGRLTKVRNRLSSATHLAPEYPPPPPPKSGRDVSLSNPTIQPVESIEPAASLEPLEPPPALEVPSRGTSPSRSGSRPGTRPGTPNLDAPSEGNLKKLRRKSRLFGGGSVSDGAIPDPQHGHNSPLAWIVGHKGKVPYNLTMLLNGEQVGCFVSSWAVARLLTYRTGPGTLGRRRRHLCVPFPTNLGQGALLPHRLVRLRRIAASHPTRSRKPI